MLTISRKQFEEISDDKSFKISSQAYQLIKEHLPDLNNNIEENEFNDRCETSITKAKQYGIKEANELLSYVITAFIFGEDFDKEMGIFKEVLNDKNITKNISKGDALNIISVEIFRTIDDDK